MTGWRLWRLLTGRYRPDPPSEDIEEAHRKRLEAEYELRHTRSRGCDVDRAVAAFDHTSQVDAFAELIEDAFARRGKS